MSDVLVLHEACSVDKVLSLREALLDEFTRFYRTPVDAEVTADIAAVIAEVVGCDEAAAATTVTRLGATCTKENLGSVAWRAAGNYTRLVKGIPIRDWRVVRSDEWCAAAFLDVRPVRLSRGGKGRSLSFRVVSGLSAGVRSEMTLSYAGWRYFARPAGFRRTTKRVPGEYEDPAQYVGFFFEALVPGTLNPREAFRAKSIRFPQRFRTRNNDLRKLRRQEVRGFQCQLVTPVDCHRCFIGRDRCDAATHPKTYLIELCSECKKTAAHVPGSSVCRNCEAEAAYKGRV